MRIAQEGSLHLTNLDRKRNPNEPTISMQFEKVHRSPKRCVFVVGSGPLTTCTYPLSLASFVSTAIASRWNSECVLMI